MHRCIFLSLLERQWSDVEGLLIDLIEKIHEKQPVTCDDDFEEKCRRFHQWFENFLHREMNQHLDGLTYSTMITFLRHDLRSIVREKEHSLEELLNQAQWLHSTSTDPNERRRLATKIDEFSKIRSSIDEHIQKKFVLSSNRIEEEKRVEECLELNKWK